MEYLPHRSPLSTLSSKKRAPFFLNASKMDIGVSVSANNSLITGKSNNKKSPFRQNQKRVEKI